MSTLPTERVFWFVWSQVEGLGPILQKRLALHFGSLEAAWEASTDRLRQVEGIGVKLTEAIAQQRPQLNPDMVSPPAVPFLTPVDDAYPTLLYEIADPPPVLYYQGNLDLLKACQTGAGVGIVGTRGPSDYGRRWTRRLTITLSRAGFLIISGLADGIDRIAHQSCLDTKGHTIAVLGTGTDVVYPYRNRDLYGAIADAGLLLSEYPPGTQPDRVHFPRRNRIIAGLSRAVLVTEAPQKSGALITAYLANDYGRDVFALPGSLDNSRCYGCLALVNQGAHLILGERMLLDTLGDIPTERAQTKTTQQLAISQPAPELDPQLAQVFQAISEEAKSLDAIVEHSGKLPTGDVLSALVQLELMGLVSQLPGMQYQRCTSLG